MTLNTDFWTGICNEEIHRHNQCYDLNLKLQWQCSGEYLNCEFLTEKLICYGQVAFIEAEFCWSKIPTSTLFYSSFYTVCIIYIPHSLHEIVHYITYIVLI